MGEDVQEGVKFSVVEASDKYMEVYLQISECVMVYMLSESQQEASMPISWWDHTGSWQSC